MKLNLSNYKNIHIGAIATFYIIALLVRLISLLVVDKCPSIETSYALQVCAALATGLGPAIGALVAMLIFKRKTEYTLLGKSVWKSIATIVIPCIVFGIIGGCDLGVTCLLAFTYEIFRLWWQRRERCIIGTVLSDSATSFTASLEPSQLMAPVLSLVERVI